MCCACAGQVCAARRMCNIRDPAGRVAGRYSHLSCWVSADGFEMVAGSSCQTKFAGEVEFQVGSAGAGLKPWRRIAREGPCILRHSASSTFIALERFCKEMNG